MMPCPSDDELRQLVLEDRVDLEAHLNDCERCRQRLDELAGVDAVGKALQPSNAPSELLNLAIEQLQSSPDGAHSTVSAGRPSKYGLPELPPSPREGFIGRLGNIDIIRIVGRGGMGVVYEGIDPALDRPVAVKVLSPHLLGDAEAKERFLREARAAAAVTHDHLVAIHAIAEADGLPYLVLQYVAGESLAQRLDRDGPLSVDEARRIGAEVARGLSAAHARGLVHRDVKPANILLEKETGRARLADFGLAKRLGRDTVTQAGVVAGTPAFMSPEQASDTAIDARSDLFSLGTVLYYAISGRLPFPAESPHVLIEQIRRCEPAPLTNAPPWFGEVVHRLLQKEPSHRIASADELASLLERSSPPKRQRPLSKRIALTAGILGLVALALFWRPEKPKAPFIVAGRDHRTLAEAVAAAVDGATITIHENGPFAAAPIKIDGKRLTIQAATGVRPKFVSEVAGKAGPISFLQSNADLSLIGIDIDWPAGAPPLVRREDTIHRCVVGVASGHLHLEKCSIIGGENAACAGSYGSSTFDIVACRITGQGTCVGWQPARTPGPSRIRDTHCSAVVGVMVLPPGEGAASLELTGDTLTCERAIRLLMDGPAREPIEITARDTTFDVAGMISLIALRGYNVNLSQSNEARDAAKRAIRWTDAGNKYRRGIQFLGGNRPTQMFALVPADVRTLDDWHALWGQSRESAGCEFIGK